MRIRVAALFVLLSTVVIAQDFRAMISGQVLDPSGAAIAGATVVATNVDTNVKLTTTTGRGRPLCAGAGSDRSLHAHV